MEKDAVNKRFGVLAFKNELATIEQVNAAFEIQKNERNGQGAPRFIGQILKHTADLTDDDILPVLLEQKQFEKRRLDLENALYTIKSEIKISKKLNTLFEYRIFQNGIEVFAKKLMETDEIIPAYEFLIWLRRAGIKFGVVNESILEEFIQKAEKSAEIIVAKGYPAKQCTNESIQFYFENKNDKPVLIEKGSLLAKINPGLEGKPGKDVLGHPIQPDKPSTCVLNAGSGVIKKGPVLIALVDGSPVLKKDTIHMVEPVVKKTKSQPIKGDISNDTKDTYESERVELHGAITREAVLRCHSLLLHGCLKGCVICTGDISVNGDIGIDEKPKNKEDTQQTRMTCQGSIKASKSIFNSNIQTAGELLAFNSTVVGSEVTAFKGMTIKDSLAGNMGPSILRVGLEPGNKILALDHTIEIKR
ncbi:MAG: DUF342 domain-containing protein, partial [Desulfobacteraceae bacterium]|nr:DUF342 domain-containing protein [Desulfobacteraceae bacterium]